MAIRKPLVVISGSTSELPPGDTVEGVVLTTTLTAGSGLSGGGALSSSQRVDVSLAAAPSGLIFVGNQLGLDGTALASGNAALVSASTAQASGNAALSRAGGTMTGPIVFAAGQQINSSVNLSGGISGAVPYQSAPSSTTFLSPGVSGQVLTTAGSNQAPVWATPAGGKILQAVQATQNTSFTTTSTTYVSTGLSLSITPSSTSSRILLITSFLVEANATGVGYYTIFRNGTTNLCTGTVNYFANYIFQSSQTGDTLAFNYIDSPSTTSATTYVIYMRVSFASSSHTFNAGPGLAVLNAFEIAP